MIPDPPMTFGHLARLGGPSKYRVKKTGGQWCLFLRYAQAVIPFEDHADALRAAIRFADIERDRDRRKAE